MYLGSPWSVYRAESEEFGAGITTGEVDSSSEEVAFEVTETEESTTEEVESDDEPEELSPEAEAMDLRDWFKSQGHEFGDDDDPEQVLTGLIEKSKRADELQRQNQSMEEQFRQWQPQQPVPQQQPMVLPPAAQRMQPNLLNHWDQPPEYDERWLNQIVRDDKGGLTVVPGADPSIIHKARAYSEWESRAQRLVNQHPHQFVGEIVLTNPVIQNAIQQQIQREVAAAVNPIRQREEAETLLSEIRDDLKDADFVRDYSNALQMVFKNGITDQKKQHEMSKTMATQLRAERAAMQKKLAPSEAKAKQIVLSNKQGAKRTPPASGSIPKAERPRAPIQSDGLNLTDVMLQALRKQSGGLD